MAIGALRMIGLRRGSVRRDRGVEIDPGLERANIFEVVTELGRLDVVGVDEIAGQRLVRDRPFAGREIGFCHMEKLTNLDLLPPHGFTVSCFPAKVKGGSAGWTRAVAILEDAQEDRA